MHTLSTLALRNLRVRPARTLLTAAGIVLGVAVIVSISITNSSILAGFEGLFSDVAGSAHLTIETTSRNGEGFDSHVLDVVRTVEGVQTAAPSTANTTMLILSDREVTLRAYGVDPAVDSQVRPYRILEGRFLTDPQRHTVVVVADLAERYDIQVGEDVTLLGAAGPAQLLVEGIMAKEGPARQAQMVMPLDASQEIFARGHRIDAIDVVAGEEMARSAEALEELKATLQERVGDGYEVLYPASRAENIVESLEGISLGLSFFAVVALFGGAYLIFNTFSMTVVERTREIGMLRALGTTRGQNVRLILIEAILLGFGGSLLGLVLGTILAIPMTRLIGGTFGMPGLAFSIPASGMVAGVIVGTVITLLSAVIPAIRAGRISPVEALAARSTLRSAGWLVKHGWKVSLALIVASEGIPRLPIPQEIAEGGLNQITFLLLLVGVTLIVPRVTTLLERLARPLTRTLYGNAGRIGAGNISRALGRTTVTVGGMTMGIVMFVTLGAQTASMTADVRQWMDAALRGDLFVTSFQPMRLELARDLAGVEGVNLATPMRLQPVKILGATTVEGYAPQENEIAFMAIRPQEYTTVSQLEFASGQGDEAAMMDRLMAGDAVFVSTMLAERYAIQKGDVVRLRTARGDQDFRVAGVIVDYTWGGWSVVASWEDLNRYFRTDKADLFILDVTEGADIETVRRRVEVQYGQRRHLEVESGQAYRERWLDEFMAMMMLFDVVVVIAVLIAGLGVANTMTMNVMERIREIGCLRAIGMTRPQVVHMILAEAVIIGLLGGLFGVAFGTYTAYFAVIGMAQSTGWELAYVLPKGLLLIGLLIALGLSQLASIYPAWRATRINIVKAVQYE